MDPLSWLTAELTARWGLPAQVSHEEDGARLHTAPDGLAWRQLSRLRRRGWTWHLPGAHHLLHVDQDAYLSVSMRGTRHAVLAAPWPAQDRDALASGPLPDEAVLRAMARWAYGLD